MIGTLIGFVFVIIIIAACCASDGSSSSTTTKKTNTNTQTGKTRHYNSYSYSECPSCGAPYFDGYCDECRYPDINQGWLGEEYG